jgi:thiamine biosynthesis lipoprotein
MFEFCKAKTVARRPRPSPIVLHQFTGQTMATQYSVSVGASSDQIDGLPRAVHKAITDVDLQMSTWKPDSDLSAFDAHGLNEWCQVPIDLAFVVLGRIEDKPGLTGRFRQHFGGRRQCA